ncbi:hypothetical protein RIF29_20237 [Crotalaria pallida]|uniref:Uncharacterized protein n=1 Tax=Crotalaria pallida TaxID=3830 RepID=A0AAN9F331_CROPI
MRAQLKILKIPNQIKLVIFPWRKKNKPSQSQGHLRHSTTISLFPLEFKTQAWRSVLPVPSRKPTSNDQNTLSSHRNLYVISAEVLSVIWLQERSN